jgi:hypothetical protein
MFFGVLVGSALVASSQAASAPARPSAILADWSRGVWQIADEDQGGNISGFKDEDAYQDLNQTWPNPPPFTPEYRDRYNKIRQEASEGRNTYDKGASCAPLGVPQISGFGLFEIFFKPGEVMMSYEDSGDRRIYTDGRKHPSGADLIPSYNGDSIGHWEGSTLVVDTVGIRDDTYLEVGMPHSKQLHVIERWKRVDANTLTNTVTIIDPEAFTKPWGTVWHWKRKLDWSINEVFCVSSRDQNVGGATTMIGPDGKPLLGPAQKGDAK